MQPYTQSLSHSLPARRARSSLFCLAVTLLFFLIAVLLWRETAHSSAQFTSERRLSLLEVRLQHLTQRLVDLEASTSPSRAQ